MYCYELSGVVSQQSGHSHIHSSALSNLVPLQTIHVLYFALSLNTVLSSSFIHQSFMSISAMLFLVLISLFFVVLVVVHTALS
jgi:hypothetical protein